MKYITSYRGNDASATSHGGEPSGNLQGRGTHNVLHVKRGVQKPDPKDTVGEEEGDHERFEIGDFEQVEWKKRLRSYPSFHVDGNQQEEGAEDEEEVDVRSSPAVGSV